jgi:hypothetical protein
MHTHHDPVENQVVHMLEGWRGVGKTMTSSQLIRAFSLTVADSPRTRIRDAFNYHDRPLSSRSTVFAVDVIFILSQTTTRPNAHYLLKHSEHFRDLYKSSYSPSTEGFTDRSRLHCNSERIPPLPTNDPFNFSDDELLAY